MLRRAARRLSSSVKAQRNEAIQKRRDARLKTVNTPYVEPSVDARERVGSRGVYLRHSTFEADGACEELTKLMRRWSAHSLVKAVVIEGVQGAFRTGDRASLYRAAAACDAPIAQLVDGLLLPGGVGLCGRGFRVCGDGAVFVPPLGAAAVEAGVTLDGGAAFACSRTGNYGRAALVSGLPVRGTALKACGLATHVVTDHALQNLAEELADVADQASDAAAARVAIQAHLDDREQASRALLNEEGEARRRRFLNWATRFCRTATSTRFSGAWPNWTATTPPRRQRSSRRTATGPRRCLLWPRSPWAWASRGRWRWRPSAPLRGMVVN